MKFSIIIPVYNEEKYIKQCIDSVLNQNYSDFEICISDNSSTDDTWNIILEYLNIDTRIKAVRQIKPILPIQNLKAALEIATGEYIYNFAGDDFLLPGFLNLADNLYSTNKNISTLLVRMNYFNDKDTSVIATLPPRNFDTNINLEKRSVLKFILDNVNHDEICLGIFKRKDFIKNINLLSIISLESYGIWVFLATKFSENTNSDKLLITDEVYLMKRYGKPEENSSNFTKSATPKVGNIFQEYIYLLKRCLGSIRNATILFVNNRINFIDFILLLFYTRKKSNNTRIFFGPILMPFYFFISRLKSFFE